ncbi:unnamed protein product [Camellia sinensis]
MGVMAAVDEAEHQREKDALISVEHSKENKRIDHYREGFSLEICADHSRG